MAKYMIEELGLPLSDKAKHAIRAFGDALLPHSNMSGAGFADMVLANHPHNSATLMAAELIRQEVEEVSVKPLHGRWRHMTIKVTNKGEGYGNKTERKVAAAMGGSASVSGLREQRGSAGHASCQGNLFEWEGRNTKRPLPALYGEPDAAESGKRVFA